MIHLSTQEAGLLLAISEKFSGSLDQLEFRLRAAEDLLRLMGADHMASYIWNPGKGIFEQGISLNMDQGNLERYESYYQFCDPITPALQKRKKATLVCQIMSQKDLERTEFFNDFLAKDGLHHGINLYAYDGDLNIGDLRIWRGKRRPDFSARDVGLLELVKPHFRNALRNARVHDELGHASSSATMCDWDSLPNACFVFDRELRLVHQNPAGRELQDELSPRQFHQLLGQACQVAGGNLQPDRWGPFFLSRFLPGPESDAGGSLVVHVQRSAKPRLDCPWLRSRFGLSGREAEIALLLVKGLTDKEIAGVLSITFHTVRAHLKSIFRKMEVSNRTELLHAMMCGLVDIELD